MRAGEHVKACFDSMVAPGSVIEGCDFRGTFRFRGPIEIRNSYFYVARMWIDLFSPYEGPVPQGVHFTGCRFVCDDEEALYFHLESQRRGTAAPGPIIWKISGSTTAVSARLISKLPSKIGPM